MVGHEVTHTFEGTEQYDALMAAMKEFAAEKGIDWEARVQEMAERYQNVKNADPEKELLADLVGEYLFTDADFVQRLSTEHRGVFQKLFDEIKHLCKLATAGTKEARELEKVKKLFEDAYRTETKKTTNDGGVRYALESKTQQGKLDPRTVTKDDVLALLHQVEDGSISGNTYIPLRIGTPQILIYWADKRNGDTIDNNPIAISADKAHNAMNRNGETSENGGRPNRLTVDEIVAMVENMNDPEYIVYQGGNDRYVEVVKFNRDNGDSAFAVLEIGNNKDAVYMNGYEGGLYNILVTTYPPITGKLKELLNGSQNKVIYDKKKDASQRTSSSTVPSVLNDASFYEDIISEPSAGVKEEKTPSPVYSLSGNEQGSVPAGEYRITGEDIALAPTKEDIARMEQEKERIATAQTAPRNDVGVQGAPDNDVEELGAPTREDILQMEMERELYGDWRMTDPLDRKVEKLYRLMLLERISEEEYNAQLVKADRQYQQRGSRIEEALERIQQAYSKYQGEAVNGAAGGKTNAVTKPLNSYPIEKQSAIRSYLQSVDEQIKSFVKRVKDGDLRFERRKVSDVNERAASDIQELLGIDVSGYTHNINTSGVQHILRRHGKNGKQDTTMSIDDDIARVGWVLDNYDSVELLTKDGEQVYSSEFKDKNNQPVPQIRFIKKIDGTYYVVEAACENEYQKLWVQSAYLQKNEDVTQVSAEGQEANHETYAQGELASPSSDNSIFQISDDVKQEEVEAVLGEKGAYVSKQANALYDEVKGMQKGKRVSNTLSYLLDTLDLSEENKAESYGSLRTALLNIRDNPNQVVNPNSAVEAAAREMLGREYDAMAEDFANAEGVAKSIYTKMESLRTELENNQSLREQSNADFDSEIARLQAEYEAKKNKNTKAANDLLRRIERVQRLKSQVDADYSKRIDRLGEQLERISKPEYKTAMQRKAKMEEYTNLMAELVIYNFSSAGTNVRPVVL